MTTDELHHATIPATGHQPVRGTHPEAVPDPPGLADDVRRVVEAAVGAVGRAGTITLASVTEAVDAAGRALTRRTTTEALDAARPLGDRRQLARALASAPGTPALATATGAALAARTLSRFPRLRFLARRSPMWLVASAVPALVASVSRGAEELGMVASHLAARARAAGVEPDPERLRRVAVQLASGRTPDPAIEPHHGRLMVSWLRRAVRAALPFTAGVATKDPRGLAAAASRVDPTLVGRPADAPA